MAARRKRAPPPFPVLGSGPWRYQCPSCGDANLHVERHLEPIYCGVCLLTWGERVECVAEREEKP